MEESDIQLIRLAKRGNADAFTQLVHNYKNYVWQIALGVVGDETEAEDVTQETFVRAFISLKRLRNEKTFPSWIATIATRHAIDTVRRRKRQQTSDADVRTLQDSAASSQFNQIEHRMVLNKLMDSLTEDERAVLVLRELHGYTYQDLSDMLEIPIGTVRSRLHNARKALKSMMANEEDAT